jgi:hypothetical protein
MASTAGRNPETVLSICEAIGRRKEILATDVAVLAEIAGRDVEWTVDEARALFALACAEHPSCPEWREFFAETVSGWFVDIHARNDVSVDAARRLIGWLGGDRARLDAARFRFLIRVLERASRCPEELLAFARACLMRAMGMDEGARRAPSHVA